MTINGVKACSHIFKVLHELQAHLQPVIVRFLYNQSQQHSAAAVPTPSKLQQYNQFAWA